ncbi:MAG: hypothetical protein RI897_791 [Verrucomicrobiota bacterium]
MDGSGEFRFADFDGGGEVLAESFKLFEFVDGDADLEFVERGDGEEVGAERDVLGGLDVEFSDVAGDGGGDGGAAEAESGIADAGLGVFDLEFGGGDGIAGDLELVMGGAEVAFTGAEFRFAVGLFEFTEEVFTDEGAFGAGEGIFGLGDIALGVFVAALGVTDFIAGGFFGSALGFELVEEGLVIDLGEDISGGDLVSDLEGEVEEASFGACEDLFRFPGFDGGIAGVGADEAGFRFDELVLSDGPEATGEEDEGDHAEDGDEAGEDFAGEVFTAGDAAAEDGVIEAVLFAGEGGAGEEDDGVHPEDDIGGVEGFEHLAGGFLFRLHAFEHEDAEERGGEEETAGEPGGGYGGDIGAGHDPGGLPAAGDVAGWLGLAGVSWH